MKEIKVAGNKLKSRKGPTTVLGDTESLVASLGYSFLSQIFYLVSQLGIISSLAHFKGPVAVGEFGLALAITTPLFILLNMGFRTAQAVDVDADFSFADYGGTRIVLTLAATLVSILIAAFSAKGHSAFVIVCVVAAAKAFESVSNLAYGAFQQAGRMGLVAASFAIRGSTTLVAFVSLLLLGADTATAFMSQMVVWAIVAVFLDYPRASFVAAGGLVLPRLHVRESLRLFRQSVPLGGGLLANSLQMTCTRFLVEYFFGLHALGLFTAVGYFQQAGVTASNSVSNAIVNRLAKLNRNGQRKKLRQVLLRLLLIFIAVGGAGIAICYFFGDVILTVLFGKQYLPATALLLVTSIAVSLRMISTLPQSLMFAERRYKEFFSFQLMSLALVFGFGYFLIPRYGILGAGYVLLIAAVFRLVVLELVLLLRYRKAVGDGAAPGESDNI